MKYLAHLVLLLSQVVLAEGISSDDFQAQRDRLKEKQQQSDKLFQGLTRRLGVSPIQSSGVARDVEESVRPLYRVHAEFGLPKIPTGKLLFGRTVNHLVVGGDGSPALIEVDDGQGAVSGIRMMGIARQAGSPGRVSLELNRLLLKSGKSVPVQATGLDSDGGYGLVAQVLSDKALAVGGAMASSFISGLASGQQTQAVNALGFSQVQPTGRNAVLQGVAQTAADQSKRLIEEATAEKPILVVDALTPVTVLIQEEVRF